MKVCSVCEKQLGMIAHKTSDGFICDDCLKYVPAHIKLKEADEKYLKKIYHEGRERAEGFEATAYLGDLYLDSVHGMFCCSKKGKNGTPLLLGDVYKITELKEIGLYTSNIRNIGSNRPKVICDVKLRVVTDKVNREYLIAKSKNCLISSANGELTCTEPADVTMIRSMFNQMIEDQRDGMMKQLGEIIRMKEIAENKPKHLQDKEWALGVMFLANKEHSEDEIKSQYRKLSKMFHPDVNPDISGEYMETLNKAYSILR